MEEFIFKPNGEIFTYKTNFVKQFLTTDNDGEDKVQLYKIGKVAVAFCCDESGHKCNLCGKMKNFFIDFSKKIICFDCLDNINEIAENIIF